MPRPNFDDDADTITTATMEYLATQVQVRGHAPDLVLAAAHCAVITAMATRHGGSMTAQLLREAADRVEQYPAHKDHPLAGVAVAGRA